MARPLVSVLMPVYGTGPFVEEALRSVLAQTLADIEVVVIDDGSRDDSLTRLQAIAAVDERVVLIARENRGVVATRNELLERARAPLVAWMDSDDIAEPERLALQRRAFAADPALVCAGTAMRTIDAEGRENGAIDYPLSHDAVLTALWAADGIKLPTCMMRTTVARRLGFRSPFPIGEDLDLFLRLAEAGRLMNLPQRLLRYRVHAASTSAAHARTWLAYRDAILELARERREHGADRLQRGQPLRMDARGLPDARLNSADRYAAFVHMACEQGERELAWWYAWHSLRDNPVHVRAWRSLARVALESLR